MKKLQFLIKLLIGSGLTTISVANVLACSNRTAAVDISSGIIIDNLQIAADNDSTYNALNTNQLITNGIAAAISSAKNVNVLAGTDFIISNNQIGTAKQTIGQTVQFTVTAIGDQIKGKFTFNETLGLPNISSGIVISDLNTPVNLQATFDSLNNNAIIIAAVQAAIQQVLGFPVTAETDFVLTNNQIPDALQIAGTPVNFTVTAIGDQITGNFQFTDTLGSISIADGIKISNLQTAAIPSALYSALNTNTSIKRAVAAAINKAKGTNVTTSDFTLTNNQTGNQIAGTAVIFTVTANSIKIKDQFTFTDTLSVSNISTGVTVKDLETPANGTAQYTTLNTNLDIINAVINSINSAKGTNITTSDFTLTNNQTGNQVVNTPVLFTVTGNGSKITGSFNFVDTLGQISIASGINILDPQTAADTGATYGALNSNPNLMTIIVNTINNIKGTTINANDIALTNNQTASATQVIGTPVIFTVTALSGQIKDSFTFTDTLSQTNIATGITIPDLGLAPTLTNTYGALNTNSTILNTVVNAINAVKNTTITTNDFVVTNNQTATANQIPNIPVIFTVTAAATSTQITGSFNFLMTLAKININTGVTVADLTTSITNGTFASLNTNAIILNAVTNAINSAKGTSITTSDFTITNNQITTAQMTAGTIIFTVTANPTSNQIAGSFTFADTLAKVNLTGIANPTTFLTKADTTKTWGSMTINPQLMAFVVDTIRGYRGITVATTPGVDLNLTINQTATTTQATGTNFVITITSVPTSNLVTGSFTINGYTNS